MWFLKKCFFWSNPKLQDAWLLMPYGVNRTLKNSSWLGIDSKNEEWGREQISVKLPDLMPNPTNMFTNRMGFLWRGSEERGGSKQGCIFSSSSASLQRTYAWWHKQGGHGHILNCLASACPSLLRVRQNACKIFSSWAETEEKTWPAPKSVAEMCRHSMV